MARACRRAPGVGGAGLSGAVDRFRDAARVEGLTIEVHTFPEGTKTAEDAARAIGCDVVQIVKSLVFTADDGTPVLALTSGRHRVDTAALARIAGLASVRRATPEEARTATGFAVGGTPPFGHPSRVRTFIDPELLRHDVVWAAAGTPDSVFPLAPTQLRAITHAVEGDFAGAAPAG